MAALTTGRQVIVGGGGQGEAELVWSAGATPNLFKLLGRASSSDVTLQMLTARSTPGAADTAGWRAVGGASPLRHRRASSAMSSGSVGSAATRASPTLSSGWAISPSKSSECWSRLRAFVPGGNERRARPRHLDAVADRFASGSRIDAFLRVIGRLKPAVSFADAQGQVEGLAARLRTQFSIKETSGLHFRLEQMDEDLVADVRTRSSR